MSATEIDGVPQLAPADAAARIAEGAFLLDVREPIEWIAGHAPDATHLPLGQLAVQHAGVVPNDKPIVAICRAGGRSQQAALALRNAGYDAVNLAGGMQAWAEAGLPVITDDGNEGQVI